MTRLHNFLKKFDHLLTPEALQELSEIADEYNYLKEIFNNSDWTISLVDHSGKYLITNPKMNQLVGNVIGKKVGSLSKDNKIQQIIEELSKTNKQEYSEIIETVLNDVRKTFYLHVTKVENKFLIMGSDITEVEELKKQQEFNERMIMLGEMSSFIVHEINNPLNSISLSADLISIISQDTKVKDQTEKIANMISVISNIILTLKSFSRKNDSLEDVNLISQDLSFQDIYNQAELILRPKLKKNGISITAEMDESTLSGNDTQLLQVLVNLISNSLDAIQNLDEKWIKVIWKNEKLSVIDSGKGIDSKIVARLFEKFHTTKGSKGNGIGLYLSKEILNKYGYDLQYQTTNDNHTSFVWSKKEAA